jgi:hypothetical protein
MKTLTKLIAGGSLIYIVMQFPLIIRFFAALISFVGVYSYALIKVNPLLFCFGFIILYGVAKGKNA